MLRNFLFCCLAAAAVPALAAEEKEGEQYRGWCTRSAMADKIPLDEREDYVRECMSSLEAADRNPDRTRRKGKKDEGDES